MGCLSEHKCPACGYEAQVSGGADGGLKEATQTFVCIDCQLLADCVILAESPDGFRDSSRNTWVKRSPRCPQCRRTRCLRRWKTGGPCPKCGTAMEQIPGFAMLWD